MSSPIHDINQEIRHISERIAALDNEKILLAQELLRLREMLAQAEAEEKHRAISASHFSAEEKIRIFMSLFRGRGDIFPRRWDNRKTGKSGYAPACHNEWVRGICNKPQVKCGECPNQAFIPVTEECIRRHLAGDGSGTDYTIGVYAMLPDETCWFLAADFDKEHWKRDVAAFLDICKRRSVPASLERSRSGNDGHVWIFFHEPVAASEARKMGAALLTETMERCPEIGFESYDRFFPNQDTMPVGGFGNLIALPLQRHHERKVIASFWGRASSLIPISGSIFRPCVVCCRRKYPPSWKTLPPGVVSSACGCRWMRTTRSRGSCDHQAQGLR